MAHCLTLICQTSRIPTSLKKDGADSTYENSTTLRVGELSTGYQAAALIRIPLSEVPQPANARVTGAELNMFAEYGSIEDEPIAVPGPSTVDHGSERHHLRRHQQLVRAWGS